MSSNLQGPTTNEPPGELSRHGLVTIGAVDKTTVFFLKKVTLGRILWVKQICETREKLWVDNLHRILCPEKLKTGHLQRTTSAMTCWCDAQSLLVFEVLVPPSLKNQCHVNGCVYHHHAGFN